jgi:hypothetical protein
MKRSTSSAKLSSQQIRAIKASPAGKLPRFIQGGFYSDKNVSASVGGRIGKVGGTIGMNPMQMNTQAR